MKINNEYEILVDSIGTYILRQPYISRVLKLKGGYR